MYQNLLGVLTKSTLFNGIDSKALNNMFKCLNPSVYNYEKNELIALSGENSKGVGIVISGKATVIKETASGTRIIIKILKQGEMFGEAGAFSGQNIWPATVSAQETCSVLFLPSEKITGDCEKKCFAHKMMIMNILQIISDRALMLKRKVEYLTIKSMRGKISTFLLEQYKNYGSLTFMISMKRRELADFLNVSRSSLSREMCRMRDEGIIEFYKSSFRIKNIETLKETAE